MSQPRVDASAVLPGWLHCCHTCAVLCSSHPCACRQLLKENCLTNGRGMLQLGGYVLGAAALPVPCCAAHSLQLDTAPANQEAETQCTSLQLTLRADTSQPAACCTQLVTQVLARSKRARAYLRHTAHAHAHTHAEFRQHFRPRWGVRFDLEPHVGNIAFLPGAWIEVQQ